MQNGRVCLANDFFRLIPVKSSRAFVPQENLAVQVLADNRVLRRGFQNVGDEIDRFFRISYDRVVKKLCSSNLLHKTDLMGNVLRDEKEANGLVLGISPRCYHYSGADAPPVLAYSANYSFPLSFSQGRLHDFARLPGSHVLGRVQDI